MMDINGQMQLNPQQIEQPNEQQRSHKYYLAYQRILKERIYQKFAETTIGDILLLVDKIHQQFGHSCLVFKYQSLTYEQRCALWSMSNIYLNTSLKEGVCMQLLEYVCVKKYQNKFEKSTAIVSEFAGNPMSMGGAIICNSYDIENISHKLEEAISMNSIQKIQRMEQTLAYIQNHSTQKWAQNFLTTVKMCKASMEDFDYKQIGFGLNLSVIKTRKGLKLLDNVILTSQYVKSKRRLIWIDEKRVVPYHRYADTTQSEPQNSFI